MMSTIAFHADDDALEAFSDDVGGLWCRPVAVLDSLPDSFTFLRDFVQPNIPCIIKNSILNDTTGATSPLTLTLDQIIHHVGLDAQLTVDVTPDGHGDCIRSVLEANNDTDMHTQRRMFVKPHEARMDIGKFRDLLRRGRGCDSDARHSCNGKINADTLDSNDLEVFHLQHHLHYDADHFDSEELFQEGKSAPAVYYSRQNDCLRTEVAKLFSTQIFPATFPFAEQAFGSGPPDAINLWIGNERSVSSMHKDHYENLFYVCSGQKEFILCPPADIVFLHEGEFSSGTFQPTCTTNADGEANDDDSKHKAWVVVADANRDSREGNIRETSEATTKWIEPDIKKYMDERANNDTEFPLLPKAHPIKVLVSEGEMLYIPSLWYHRVTQTCETVGVNYWFDMKFDSPYWCYFNLLQNMKRVK